MTDFHDVPRPRQAGWPLGRSGRQPGAKTGRPVALAAIAALVLAFALPAGPALAQQATEQPAQQPAAGIKPPPQAPQSEEISRHGDWSVQCFPPDQSGQRHCEAVQVVAQEGSQQPLLRIAVGKAPGNGPAVLQFIVPLGAQLQRGFKLSIDGGAPRDLAATTCLPFGCIVETRLDSGLLAAMRAGAQGKMSVVDLRNKQIGIPISLSGFTAATGEVL